MAGPIFAMPVRLLAAIRALRGAQRVRLLVIFWLWAAGFLSVPFASDTQALGLMDDATVGCIGCAGINATTAPPYWHEGDNRYSGGPLAYATPGDDGVARTENTITINDARPFEASTQIRLHRFLQPYEVIKQVDRHAVQSRIKQAASNKKQATRRALPLPPDIGAPGTTPSTFAALPPRPADAAQLANGAVVEGRNLEIVSADEVNSIDLAADPSGPTASQNVSPQALAVIAGALAGAAVGLFLISWLENGRDFQVRKSAV